MQCPLCLLPQSTPFFQDPRTHSLYFLCPNCRLRFLAPESRLPPEAEKARYLEHNNDLNDAGYQAFAQPLVEVVQRHIPRGARGLDFGSGTSPVLQHLLTQAGYSMEIFDSFFAANDQVWSQSFHFIVACEVFEHLFHPRTECQRLANTLLPEGILVISTVRYDSKTDFSSWYYRRDPTHVCFFSVETFDYIRAKFGFSTVDYLSPRLVMLRRQGS